MHFWDLTALLTRYFFNPFIYLGTRQRKQIKFSVRNGRAVWAQESTVRWALTIVGGVRSHYSLLFPIPLPLFGVSQKRCCEIWKRFNHLLVAQVSTTFKVQNVKPMDWITERERPKNALEEPCFKSSKEPHRGQIKNP